ncbi:MAG TPA: ABC-2 family transporter protein [Polyangiaceae bacterium]|nr:ABC-2 family transporter protein [Polyangiaceae bacterium]
MTASQSLGGELATQLSLLLRALRTSFTYKPSLLMSALSAGFAYAVPMLVWKHVYATAPRTPAVPAATLFPYLLIAGCLNFVFAMNVEGRIGQRIRMGLIATDLLKPVDFQLTQLTHAFSDAVVNTLLVLPLLAIAYALWGSDALPHSWPALLVFAPSVLLALLILFAVSFIFVQATFVTYSSYGVFVARSALQLTFSGLSAPLALFPAGLLAVSAWLPFQHTIHTPVAIYLGWLRGDAALRALFVQLSWALGLVLLGRGLFRLSLRKLDIQGG